ncbi:hypothetical protein [Salmonella phage SD-15_S21]|nr:hypothetical protein [Salmonella phage SD-15_S21]
MSKKDASKKHSVHFSTGKDNWTTPKDFFEDLDELHCVIIFSLQKMIHCHRIGEII